MRRRRKTQNNNNLGNKKTFTINKNLKNVLGLFLLFLAIYLLVSFLSFLFYGGIDQSQLDISRSEFMRNPEIRVANLGGKEGAYLSHLFINRGLGIASFGLLYLLFLYALALLNIKPFSLLKSTLLVVSLVVVSSVAFSYFLADNYKSSHLAIGGLHGYYISHWLNAAIGEIGTLLLIIFSYLAILILSVRDILGKVKGVTQVVKNKKEQFFDKQGKAETEVETTEDETENIEVPNTYTEEPIEEPKYEKPEIIQKTLDTDNEKVSTDVEAMEVTISEKDETVKAPSEDYDPTLDLSKYKKPPIDLLKEYPENEAKVTPAELEDNKNRIVETLKHYSIEITKIKATIGPTITLYEIVPAPGVRISKIKNLEDDIALSLSALGIRIIAPIPGKGTIGIEVPNKTPEIVSMHGVVLSKKFQESKYELPVVMGRTISNESFVFDLTKMPHLLVAGATGQGKSVGMNAIITSLLYKKHPSQLKFVMVDPKMVEFSIYSKIEKHFLAKLPDEDEAIITDVSKVVATLQSICIEMDDRYDLLKKAHARNLIEYNGKFIKRKLNPENGHKYLPYIVVLIDEFADLIMTAGKEVEMPIARIAQKARAVGIHMIIATQRPSTNIITGVIKANFPARIAFKVASMIDSRTILDSPGANQLIGRGDMLFSQGSQMVRLQCAFVDTPEVEAITDFISEQRGYPMAFELPEYKDDSSNDIEGTIDLQQRDSLFEEAARLVVSTQQGSTSGIQRRFSIGYNRAGRIIDQLEAAGIVGPFEGSKARQVLIPDELSLEQFLEDLDLR
ncbi:S-DNA-T family DNA segregation ATPase FtsK/SpoIIIE [Balneicella halophila]|uniref:S-DNA-T family DNA segregation ATPase FtsK/SpoIIIE n=1 Tax=Balneicella halophila TaxID=1537566 RepID=A0A7L4URD4_BALHA|nr:DNA translocase FtsK 4TM domain-containing protein [Balneicella halophila]PVX52310.1 S-DNA-T family DNA segregation ATPase FtsK/SpoIIIE [Balneicella halophila]